MCLASAVFLSRPLLIFLNTLHCSQENDPSQGIPRLVAYVFEEHWGGFNKTSLSPPMVV